MLIETRIPVPATERIKQNVQCDLCGAVANHENRWNGFLNTATVGLGVIWSTWNDDGEEYSGEVFDCCPSCFEQKVKPALVALGLKARETECNW